MIRLLTCHSDEYLPLARITMPSKIEYALKHGYSFCAEPHQLGAVIAWDRPRIWRKHLDHCSWLFFTGTDVAITDKFERNLSAICEMGRPEADFYFAVDHNGLQSDSWIMRSCDATKSFLDGVIACQGGMANEQDAMQVLLSRSTSYSELRGRVDGRPPGESLDKCFDRELNQSKVRCRILPRKLINAYPQAHYGPDGVDWESAWNKTSFCIHMPGKSLEYRLKFMPEYLK